MVLKSQWGSFMVTWQMVCESYRYRLVKAQLNHTSRCVFADDAMKLRGKKILKIYELWTFQSNNFFHWCSYSCIRCPSEKEKRHMANLGWCCFCLICLYLKLEAKSSYMDISKPSAAQWFGDENHQAEPWSAAYSLSGHSGQNSKIRYPASASVCKLFPQSYIWFISLLS